MKKFSLKVLSASMITFGPVFAGAALPAQAAPITSPSVVTTGLVQGQTNPNPIVITMTTPTGAEGVNVAIPSDWSWAQTMASASTPCVSPAQVTGFTVTFCRFGIGSFPLDLYASNNVNPIAAGTTVTITLDAGALNVGSATDFVLSFQNGPTVVDTSTVSVGVTASHTVTFDSNGGSGAMADQTASSATSLSANAFTRSGYSFTGWNTAADGSGTAYADGASYAFTANTTLYAQWTATLATTGFDSAPYLFSGLGLAAVGGAFLLIARRKQSS